MPFCVYRVKSVHVTNKRILEVRKIFKKGSQRKVIVESNGAHGQPRPVNCKPINFIICVNSIQRGNIKKKLYG